VKWSGCLISTERPFFILWIFQDFNMGEQEHVGHMWNTHLQHEMHVKHTQQP